MIKFEVQIQNISSRDISRRYNKLFNYGTRDIIKNISRIISSPQYRSTIKTNIYTRSIFFVWIDNTSKIMVSRIFNNTTERCVLIFCIYLCYYSFYSACGTTSINSQNAIKMFYIRGITSTITLTNFFIILLNIFRLKSNNITVYYNYER